MKDVLQAWMDYIKPIVGVDIQPAHYKAFMAGAAAEREEVALLVERMGIEGYGTLAIAAAIRQRRSDEQR
jgi:hypothetical protein